MHSKFFILIALFFIPMAVDASNNPKIEFTLSFPAPQTHYVDVEMLISNIRKQEIEVSMPVWAPGSYLVREFAKNVESFSAEAQGHSLAFEKTRKNTWKIATKGNKSIRIKYRVYAYEISVRTSFVDASHAFISPTGIFMYMKQSLKEPVQIKIQPHASWSKISTGLEKVAENTYYAQDFDWLYDSPIEIGNQDIFEFDAAGVKHEVAMVGGGNYDKIRLAKDMAKIVEEATAIFGENPNKRYVFIVHHYKNGGGGLEHLNSTVLGAKREGYTNATTYSNFLSLVAHEYFHLWHVKRLRPMALGPFDYDNENYTTDLWIAEGFTAFYDNLLIRKTNAISESAYLQLLENDISQQINLPGDRIQSVADASFDAWIKYYRPNENSSNSTVSYYTKGSLLAMILNLEIINQSKGKKSLDNVLKAAYDEYYKKKNRGFTSNEFKKLLEKELGKNLDDFYKQYIHGTEAIDYNTYLNYAGLELQKDKSVKASLAISLNKDNIVTKVIRDGAGWAYGINVNDEIIALDGKRTDDVDTYLAGKKVGDEIDVLLNRDGVLHSLKAKLGEDRTERINIVKTKNISEQQQVVYKKWLGGL